MNWSPLKTLRAATAALMLHSSASAQTPVPSDNLNAATVNTGPMLVYKLSFEPAGETINYSPFTGGYYVAPITGGPGSLILTRATGNNRQYFDYANFGELFLALKNTNRKAVISATAANNVSSTTFYAIGDANDKVEIATASLEGSTFVASTLKGYAVSADSERDLPFASSTASDIGVAGASYLTAKLDTSFSEKAKDNAASLSGTVAEILDLLASQNYTDGNPTTGLTTGGSATAGVGSGAVR